MVKVDSRADTRGGDNQQVGKSSKLRSKIRCKNWFWPRSESVRSCQILAKSLPKFFGKCGWWMRTIFEFLSLWTSSRFQTSPTLDFNFRQTNRSTGRLFWKFRGLKIFSKTEILVSLGYLVRLFDSAKVLVQIFTCQEALWKFSKKSQNHVSPNSPKSGVKPTMIWWKFRLRFWRKIFI